MSSEYHPYRDPVVVETDEQRATRLRSEWEGIAARNSIDMFVEQHITATRRMREIERILSAMRRDWFAFLHRSVRASRVVAFDDLATIFKALYR